MRKWPSSLTSPRYCLTTISSISDGRGNVNDSALPECQLLEIDAYVRKLQGTTGSNTDPGWFWMDTLCIPSHLIISTEYKEETRASFKRSTEEAVGTLVLDADIRQMSREFTYSEAFLRINFSSWSSRMWTLQEAVLTPRIFLQLKDDIADLQDIVTAPGTDVNSLNLPVEPFTIYDKLRKFLSGGCDGDSIRSPARCSPTTSPAPCLTLSALSSRVPRFWSSAR